MLAETLKLKVIMVQVCYEIPPSVLKLSMSVWPWVERVEMNCNIKNAGGSFQVLACFQHDIKNSVDISLAIAIKILMILPPLLMTILFKTLII